MEATAETLVGLPDTVRLAFAIYQGGPPDVGPNSHTFAAYMDAVAEIRRFLGYESSSLSATRARSLTATGDDRAAALRALADQFDRWDDEASVPEDDHARRGVQETLRGLAGNLESPE